MADNLSNLLNQLSEKAGITPDNKLLVELLAHTELNNIKIHQDMFNALSRNLISVTDAKNDHPDIKRHYFAETMSNVDRVLNKIYKDLELSDEEVAEFNKESSSTKRIALVAKHLKEQSDSAVETYKKKHSKDPDETKNMRDQINALNEQLRVEKEGRTADKTSHESALNTFTIDNYVYSKLGALKTVFDTLPLEVKNTTIKTLLDKELQDNTAHIVLDENRRPVLKKKDGTNYYNEQQQQVTIEKFIEQTLTKTKSLIQSPPNGQPPRNPQQQQPLPGNPAQPQDNGGANRNVIPGLSDLINETQQSLNNSNPAFLIGGGQP